MQNVLTIDSLQSSFFDLKYSLPSEYLDLRDSSVFF